MTYRNKSIKSAKYIAYQNKIKEELALKIKSIVEENNAGFAFPSQSIYVEKNT